MSSQSPIILSKLLLGAVFVVLCLCASVADDGEGRCRQENARLVPTTGQDLTAVGLEPVLELEETTSVVKAPAVPASARWRALCGRGRLLPAPGTETGAAPRPEDDPALPRPPPA